MPMAVKDMAAVRASAPPLFCECPGNQDRNSIAYWQSP
jgi:hypothetical protein